MPCINKIAILSWSLAIKSPHQIRFVALFMMQILSYWFFLYGTEARRLPHTSSCSFSHRFIITFVGGAIRIINIQIRLCRFLFFLCQLKLIQLLVNAVLLQQFLMRAGFANSPVVHHDNAVSVLNGRKAVRDHNRRAALHQPL